MCQRQAKPCFNCRYLLHLHICLYITVKQNHYRNYMFHDSYISKASVSICLLASSIPFFQCLEFAADSLEKQSEENEREGGRKRERDILPAMLDLIFGNNAPTSHSKFKAAGRSFWHYCNVSVSIRHCQSVYVSVSPPHVANRNLGIKAAGELFILLCVCVSVCVWWCFYVPGSFCFKKGILKDLRTIQSLG